MTSLQSQIIATTAWARKCQNSKYKDEQKTFIASG
jgi:hypothetical protein